MQETRLHIDASAAYENVKLDTEQGFNWIHTHEKALTRAFILSCG